MGNDNVISFAAKKREIEKDREGQSLDRKTFITTKGRQTFRIRQRIAIELDGQFRAATIKKIKENSLVLQFSQNAENPRDDMEVYPAQHNIEQLQVPIISK